MDVCYDSVHATPLTSPSFIYPWLSHPLPSLSYPLILSLVFPIPLSSFFSLLSLFLLSRSPVSSALPYSSSLSPTPPPSPLSPILSSLPLPSLASTPSSLPPFTFPYSSSPPPPSTIAFAPPFVFLTPPPSLPCPPPYDTYSPLLPSDTSLTLLPSDTLSLDPSGTLAPPSPAPDRSPCLLPYLSPSLLCPSPPGDTPAPSPPPPLAPPPSPAPCSEEAEEGGQRMKKKDDGT